MKLPIQSVVKKNDLFVKILNLLTAAKFKSFTVTRDVSDAGNFKKRFR